MRRRGVNLVVDHPSICSWAKPCSYEGHLYPSVFIRMAGGKALRSRYLIRSPELSKLLLDNPAAYKLQNMPHHLLHQGAMLFDFEDGRFPPGFVAEGDAFAHGPTRGPVRGQREIPNYEGSFLINSYHPSLGQQATGRLVISPLVVRRRYLNFHFAGGRDAERLRVTLKDGDHVIHRVTGQRRDTLRHVRWDLSKRRGRELSLTFEDESSEPWGYLVADAFYVTD
jgi:hypothetical protein